jgi:virginiamycin B lyase
VVFSAPHRRPNGLAADPDGLWVGDLDDNRVYKVRYDDGAVMASFDTPARKISGLASGGGAIWASHNSNPSMVFKFDPTSGHCLDMLFLSHPGQGGVHGLEWDDGSLWVSRPGLKQLQRIDPRTGEIRQEIALLGDRSHGLFMDGDRIACDDTGLSTLFVFHKDTGRLLEQIPIQGLEPHGMTLGPDGRIWFTDDRANAIAVAEWRAR